MSCCVKRLLSFISRHQSATTSFRINCLNTFTDWRLFPLPKWNLIFALTSFLSNQRSLKTLDFTSCRFSADDGMRILRALHISPSRLCLKHLDLHEFFQKKYSATTGSRFTILMTTSFPYLQELGVDATHVNDGFLTALTTRSTARLTLRTLRIYFEMLKAPKKCVTEACWDTVRKACPGLNASFTFDGWLPFEKVKEILCPSVPLTKCVIMWPRIYHHQSDWRGDLAQTINYIAQNYKDIIESFAIRSDIPTYDNLENAIISSATSCRCLKEFKVTLRMNPEAVDTIRERLVHRTPAVDFSLAPSKLTSQRAPRIRSRKRGT